MKIPYGSNWEQKAIKLPGVGIMIAPEILKRQSRDGGCAVFRLENGASISGKPQRPSRLANDETRRGQKDRGTLQCMPVW